MKQGAVAIVDALGFRGIWTRPDVKADEAGFIEALRGLERRAAADAEELSATGKGFIPRVRATFLSDTIVVAVEADTASQPRPKEVHGLLNVAIAVAASRVSELLRQGASAPLRLAYRGCITVGDFFVDERILMGPAIDEAASLHQLAQGALVWLAPSALSVVSKSRGGPTDGEPGLTVPWCVPLKGGDRISTRVVSPFGKRSSRLDVDAITRDILATFEGGMGRLDVVIKSQNTEAFLKHAPTG